MSHEEGPLGPRAGVEAPVWVQASAWVIRRSKVAPCIVNSGDGDEPVTEYRTQSGQPVTTEPEELNTVEGRRLRRLMLADRATYRKAAQRAVKPGVVVRWYGRIPEGEPVTFQPEISQGGESWAGRLSKKRAAAAKKKAHPKLEHRVSEVAKVLAKHPTWSAQRIADKTGIPLSTVSRIKKFLTSKIK